MNPSALEQLKDIHLPHTVSWWPPAPGWWILAGLVLLMIILSIRWWIKRHQYRAAIRQALDELESIDNTNRHWPQHINTLLKRLTLSYFPRTQSASLHQQRWLDFLASRLPEKKQPEFISQYQSLLDSLYQAEPPELDAQTYKQLARNWIRQALPPSAREVADV